MKLIYIASIFIVTISCKQDINNDKDNKEINTVEKDSIEKENSKISSKEIYYDFDFTLLNNEEIFWPLEGVLGYENNYKTSIKNEVGNINIYFFSKSGALMWQEKMDNYSDEEVDEELNRIKNLSLENFKKEFNIYAFVIDKQYLQDTPEGPYQKAIYERVLYHHNIDKDTWVKIDSFATRSSDDFMREREWSKKKLEELVK